MGREEEIREAIELSDIMLAEEKVAKENKIIEQKLNELAIARKIANKKIQKRKFKKYLIVGAVLVGLTVSTSALSKEAIRDLKIEKLMAECDIHAGYDRYGTQRHGLQSHLENCKMPHDIADNFQDRFAYFCEKYGLPEYMAEVANARFNYYFYNDYEAGKVINIHKIDNKVRKMQENGESGIIELKNGDYIEVNGEDVSYVKGINETKGLR